MNFEDELVKKLEEESKIHPSGYIKFMGTRSFINFIIRHSVLIRSIIEEDEKETL